MKKAKLTFAVALFIGTFFVTAASVAVPDRAFAVTIKNPAVGKPFKEAQELAKAHQWREALAKAREAQAVSGKSAAESAAINQFIAYAAMQAGDYALVLQTYDKMIAAGEVERSQGLKVAMELALHAGNASKAIAYANQLGGNLSGQDRLALASIYYQQGNYKEVIHMLRPSADSGTPGQEALEMLRSAYYKEGNDAGVQYTLESLVRINPTLDHWRALIRSVELKSSLSDHQNLFLYRLKLAVGDMNEKDYINMAELALEFNLPNEAKNVLTKGFAAKLLSGDRNQKLMDRATTAIAQDQASFAARDAQARSKPDGEADVKVGEDYWSYARYADAIEAIQRGIKKNQLKNPDDAKLGLGLALFGQGRHAEAVKAFNSVDKTSREAQVARLWAFYAERG